MNSPACRAFIGAPSPGDVVFDGVSLDPANDDDVLDFFLWCFGGEKEGERVDPVVTDSRKLQQIGTILDSAEAVAVLRATGDFEEADRASGGPMDRLERELRQAVTLLGRSTAMAGQYSGAPSIIQLVEDCQRVIKALVEAISPGEEPEAVQGAEE